MRREMDGDLTPLHRHLGMKGKQDLSLRSMTLLVPATRHLLRCLEHPPLLRSLRW